MHREQSSLYQSQAVNAIYLEIVSARRDYKVKYDTPPTSPHPTPSTAAATPTLLHQHPTLARTSRPPKPIWPPPSQTGAQTA
ncbi:hypothetical protein A2U01_0075307, partial [Trifolium medium]|nr:hypothetical protein [Trifolium medium]